MNECKYFWAEGRKFHTASACVKSGVKLPSPAQNFLFDETRGELFSFQISAISFKKSAGLHGFLCCRRRQLLSNSILIFIFIACCF